MAYLSYKELKSFNFKVLGKNVRISEKASIYNPTKISSHDNVRVDDFCILSAGEGGISLGKYVHVACYSSLIGKEPIILEDFSGISGRVSIYSSNDDYSGNCLCHPTVPEKYRNVHHGKVVLKRHSIVGAGSIVLPGVEIGVGVVVGSLSLVKEDCEDFGVYIGCPAKRVKWREKKLLELEEEVRKSEQGKTS